MMSPSNRLDSGLCTLRFAKIAFRLGALIFLIAVLGSDRHRCFGQKPEGHSLFEGSKPIAAEALRERLGASSIKDGALVGEVIGSSPTEEGTWYGVNLERETGEIWTTALVFTPRHPFGETGATFESLKQGQHIGFHVLSYLEIEGVEPTLAVFGQSLNQIFEGYPIFEVQDNSIKYIRPRLSEKSHRSYSVSELSAVPDDPRTLEYPNLVGFIQLKRLDSTGLPPIYGAGYFIKDRQKTSLADLMIGTEINPSMAPIEDAPESWEKEAKADSISLEQPKFWIKADSSLKPVINDQSPDPEGAKTQLNRIRAVLSSHHPGVIGSGEEQHFFWIPRPECYREETWGKILKTELRDAMPSFAKSLRKRGCQLLIVIKPESPTLAPGKASNLFYDFETMGRIDTGVSKLLDHWRSSGIYVIDPTEDWIQTPHIETPVGTIPAQLPTDSHWSAAAAWSLANRTGDLIKRHRLIPERGEGDSVQFSINWRTDLLLGNLFSHFEPGLVEKDTRAIGHVSNQTNPSEGHLREKSEVHVVGASHARVPFPDTGFHAHLAAALGQKISVTTIDGRTLDAMLACLNERSNLTLPKVMVWVISTSAIPEIHENSALQEFSSRISKRRYPLLCRSLEEVDCRIEKVPPQAATDMATSWRVRPSYPEGEFRAQLELGFPGNLSSQPGELNLYLSSSTRLREQSHPNTYRVRISHGGSVITEVDYIDTDKDGSREKIVIPLKLQNEKRLLMEVSGIREIQNGLFPDDPLIISPEWVTNLSPRPR